MPATSQDYNVATESASVTPSETRSRDVQSSPTVEFFKIVLIIPIFFWETTAFFTLVGIARYFNWQVTTGIWLALAFLVVVHWYGLRNERGMQLVVMWAALFLVSFISESMQYGFGSANSDGLDCEWGRYALPC